jgi:hypothetical protein
MGFSELLPMLRQLSRAQKLEAMQFLVSELAQEEAQLLKPDTTYPIYSPYDSNEAAHQLAQLLEEHKKAE